MKETLVVDGMTCSKCEAAVTNALNEVQGVNGVSVDLSTGNVEVEHDNVDKSVLANAIEDQGYDVRK